MNGYDLNPKCEHCGKPISETNEYGMFCEDFCGLEESKNSVKAAKAIVESLENVFKDMFLNKL